MRRSLAELAFVAGALAFPAVLRDQIGADMERAFRAALKRRRERAGRRAAVLYTARSVVDVIGTGMRERWALRRKSAAARMRGESVMREIWTDVRQGARRLRRSPGFSFAAIGLLAFGIGANTAVFSALKATLLAAPPYPSPERLVWLEMRVGPTEAEAESLVWSWRKFQILNDGSAGTLTSVAGYGVRPTTLSGDGSDPARVTTEVVSADYFQTLGVPMAAGSPFGDRDFEENGPLAVILGHALWRDRFGGDPTLIGRTVTINDRPVDVVGVAAPGFEGLSGTAQAWLPAPAAGRLISRVMLGSGAHWMFVVGRLAEGVDPESVPARLQGVAATVNDAYPIEGMTGYAAVSAEPLREARTNTTSRTALLVLTAAAAMVLLISCANLAGLLAARGRSRKREAAIRLSLGAGRGRIIRSALVEAGLLASAGAAGGLLLAHWGLAGMRTIWPERFLRPEGAPLQSLDLALFRLDPVALLFAAGAAALTAVLFGLLPALRQARVPAQEALREGGGATARRGRRGGPAAPAVLVAGQTALALVLLVGAGLMMRTLLELHEVPLGFDPADMLVMDVTGPRAGAAAEDPLQMRTRLLERLAGLPLVETATFGCAPLEAPCWIAGVRSRDGRTVELDAGIGVHGVPDNYFDALRVPLRAGRTFTPQDHAESPPVLVLNELAARALFGQTNAIGRTVSLTVEATPEGREAEVIGIVGNVLHGRPGEGPAPEAYFTERQMVYSAPLLVRTRGEPLDAVAPLRAEIRQTEPAAVVDAVRTMRDIRGRSSSETRVMMLLLGLFACAALVLAGAGIWAVVALAVSERRRELGLRMALGARAGEIIGMVVREGVVAALAGAIVGVWAAWGLSRLLTGLLFQTDVHEPVAFVGAVLVLLIGAGVASLVPARHATRVDPARTLRAD